METIEINQYLNHIFSEDYDETAKQPKAKQELIDVTTNLDSLLTHPSVLDYDWSEGDFTLLRRIYFGMWYLDEEQTYHTEDGTFLKDDVVGVLQNAIDNLKDADKIDFVAFYQTLKEDSHGSRKIDFLQSIEAEIKQIEEMDAKFDVL